MRNLLALSFVVSLSLGSTSAQGQASMAIPAGAKVFIAPMENGFRAYLVAAIETKGVPLTVVEDRSQAQFEISGTAESEKASAAKKIIQLNFHSSEQASVKVTNLETASVVFA